MGLEAGARVRFMVILVTFSAEKDAAGRESGNVSPVQSPGKDAMLAGDVCFNFV
jgi:hypothetical protein